MPDERPDPLIERVAAALRRPVHVDPAFDGRVLDAIHAAAPPGAAAVHRAGAGDRLVVVDGDANGRAPRDPGARVPGFAARLTRRTLALSPLGALAAAALIAALAAAGTRIADGLGPGARGEQSVEFVLVAPAAAHVAVAGDFNDWSASSTPMHRTPSGAWSATVRLRPGRYTYSFVVDGTRWIPDPLAPPSPRDDFGTTSSVVMVAGRSL